MSRFVFAAGCTAFVVVVFWISPGPGGGLSLADVPKMFFGAVIVSYVIDVIDSLNSR